jgi:branched-chain amino acid transport system ATP-binding protein
LAERSRSVTEERPSALALENITSGYEGSVVLRDVTLRVPQGHVVALLGPNGAGKTTLMRTASGSIRPTSGRVFLDGTDITAFSVSTRARHGICDIPEGRGIFPSLTVKENLILQAPRGRERDFVAIAVEAFPFLGSRLSQIAGNLSGGEQQMLALSRAYAGEPRILLVDEVSLGLAPVVVDRLFEFLTALVEGGTALLIVEQYVTRALELASEVYLLNRGSVVFAGRSSDLSGSDIFERYLDINVDGSSGSDTVMGTQHVGAGEA